ncbi:gluconate 2-dehydrogenase subunit 3 family protein [Candidatus Sumerlaeota bacterium]|nr:gluconate 2-dehydrogenase subunit 3 family protein [Candidatus Sumerlaeota bacterium]
MVTAGGGLIALSLTWPALAQSDPLEIFEPELINDLVALGETLVPEDVTPGMGRDDVLRWLEQRMARDRDTPIWLRRAMPTLEAGVEVAGEPGARFAALSAEQRHAVLVHLLDDPGEASGSDWDLRVVRSLIEGFYNSPIGYTVVGYRDHTGTSLAGDVTSYTGPAQMPGEGETP